MSGSITSSDLLSILIGNTTSELKDIDRSKIRTGIKKILQELPLKEETIKFQASDISYKLRYRYAVTFWKEKTKELKNESVVSKQDAENLINELKEELNSKECIHSEAKDDEADYAEDPFFFKETPTKSKSRRRQSSPVWYITCKCENKFYAKPADRNKKEVEIDRKEVELCDYVLICPGDEVQVNTEGTGRILAAITRSTGLTSVAAHDAMAKFIQDLLTSLLSGKTSALAVFNCLCERYQGIWNEIKNDEDLSVETPGNIQRIKEILELSLLLSKKLSKFGKTRCQRFLEDLSLSLFFIVTLPSYINKYDSGLNRDEINNLKFLLKLMIQCTPQTATKVLHVAKYLANAMHEISIQAVATENTSTCSGVEYLVQLGKILAKSVPGYQDVDTSNCEWNELPTIPTEKEILTAFDLDSLCGIRRDKPYDEIKQYLETNYKLLREECFRNLCTAIQDFRVKKSFDPTKMKLYRISLDTIHCADFQVIQLVLNCDDYFKKQGKESGDEIEDTSSEFLYGNLVCISLNKKFDTFIWATVVKFEMPKDSDRKTVFVRLCSDRNKMTDNDILLELLALTNEGEHALMAESATFFQAFGPSMDRLKEIYDKEDLPLVEELVKGKKFGPPEYTQDINQTCDWNIIFNRHPGYELPIPKDQPHSPIQQYKHLKDKLEVSQHLLDETQMMGIENFLENRVSLIQGPPGTGKSFLGAKILHLMLSMEIPKRYGGPILVMTYKNLALDHFLETCLQYNPKIVRIGKAGNEKLAKINLREVRKGRGVAKELHSDMKTTKEMQTSRSKLKTLFKYLSHPVFTLQSFLQTASDYHIRSLLTMSTDVDLNTRNKTVLDDLLSKWKQDKRPTQLKELVKQSLDKWLPPKKKFAENVRCYTTKRQVSDHQECSLSTSTADEEGFEDAIDRKVVAQERQKDAVEEDFGEGKESGIVLEDEESGCEDEPLTEDIRIPFMYKSDKESETEVDEKLNLWELSHEQRVNFIYALQSKLIHEFRDAVTLYEENAKKHQEAFNEDTFQVLKKFDVICMTITGAATRSLLLNELEPCAVIVEEAAEIIEGQLISVLPPTIKHLVMLGDQEQLKPRISCYALKKKKNLDCSMFERLITNQLPFQQLGRQCRMHEDVAKLLCSLDIYKNFTTNMEKTSNNNPPECIGCRLFFVKHTEPESETKGSKSVWNQEEIKLISGVAEYLMKNKYSPSKVTVLCPYREQVDRMKAEFTKKSVKRSEEYFTKLKDINITTVDSFQGEENEVILLSMVRSNRKETIGFFSERNRICVALSRAKCALYLFGNVSVYSRSRDWKKIITLLEKKGLVGERFPFREDRSGKIITLAEQKCLLGKRFPFKEYPDEVSQKQDQSDTECSEVKEVEPSGSSYTVNVCGKENPTFIGDGTTVNINITNTVNIDGKELSKLLMNKSIEELPKLLKNNSIEDASSSLVSDEEDPFNDTRKTSTCEINRLPRTSQDTSDERIGNDDQA